MTVIVTVTIPIGTAGSAVPVNANFAAIKASVNGALNNGNVADGAGILPTQLALGPSEGSVLVSNSGAVEWRSGMTLLGQVTTVSDVTNMNIQSIPSGYSSLVAYVFARGDNATTGNEFCNLRFNNDSGANYYSQYNVTDGNVQASAESLGATSGQALFMPRGSALANSYGETEIWIPQYAAGHRKSWLSIGGHTAQTASPSTNGHLMGGVWASTSAIDRITFIPITSTNFKAGSFFRLYGIT